MSEVGTSPSTAAADAPTLSLGALRHRDFRVLWTASVISNIGPWMHIVAQGWPMYQLTDSAFRLLGTRRPSQKALRPERDQHPHRLWIAGRHRDAGDLCSGRPQPLVHLGICRSLRAGFDLWISPRSLAVRRHRSNLGIGRSAPLVAEASGIRRMIGAGCASCARRRRFDDPAVGA